MSKQFFDLTDIKRSLVASTSTGRSTMTISTANQTVDVPVGPGTCDVVLVSDNDTVVGVEFVALLPEFVDGATPSQLADEQRFADLCASVCPTAHATATFHGNLTGCEAVVAGDGTHATTIDLPPGDYTVWLWKAERGPHGNVVCRAGVYGQGVTGP